MIFVGSLYTHTHMHTCIHTYTHTYMHAYIHTHIHTHIHTDIHTYRHTDIHTYPHTYIHTYIHTYRHTYISRLMRAWLTRIRRRSGRPWERGYCGPGQRHTSGCRTAAETAAMGTRLLWRQCHRWSGSLAAASAPAAWQKLQKGWGDVNME